MPAAHHEPSHVVPLSFDRRERAADGAPHRARQRSREGPLYALFDCRKKDAENAAAASQGALRLRPPLAKFLQDAFTQQIGIALAGFGQFDDSLGDDFIGEIAAVRKPKGYASHFERDAQDALGLGVEFGVVQEWGDPHGRPSSRRRERDRSLSHRRLWEPLPVVMKSYGRLLKPSVRLPTHGMPLPQSGMFHGTTSMDAAFVVRPTLRSTECPTECSVAPRADDPSRRPRPGRVTVNAITATTSVPKPKRSSLHRSSRACPRTLPPASAR